MSGGGRSTHQFHHQLENLALDAEPGSMYRRLWHGSGPWPGFQPGSQIARSTMLENISTAVEVIEDLAMDAEDCEWPEG